jgi:hypothetical protein
MNMHRKKNFFLLTLIDMVFSRSIISRSGHFSDIIFSLICREINALQELYFKVKVKFKTAEKNDYEIYVRSH